MPTATSLPILAPDTDTDALEATARRVHRVLAELLRLVQLRDRDRICCHDVSVTQCWTLEVLADRGALTLGGLAAALRLDKSTTSRVVDALERKGYARRRPHPEDGRALLVEATDAGRALQERIEGDLVAEVRGVVGELDPAVREATARALEGLLRATAVRVAGDGACCGDDGTCD